jgi:hypothetical protein
MKMYQIEVECNAEELKTCGTLVDSLSYALRSMFYRVGNNYESNEEETEEEEA